MPDRSDRPSEDVDEVTGEDPGRTPRGTGRWGKAVAAVAALGGFGGLALLLPVLVGMFDDDPKKPAPTVVASESPSATATARDEFFVRFEQPAARGGEQAEISLCSEFRGRSRLADGYRLWVAGRVTTEDVYTLFGEATVSAATGTWRLTAQVGNEEQKGVSFEITAVPVPVSVSDYLLDATDYQGRHLTPHDGDDPPPLGLRNTALPPGSDTRHGDSITVRRNTDSRC
ncbi:hypothetical protein IAG44_41750 [Streptomyces roseirectus]|uniref:Uncharacterized protein n=1 Tax=Streptomyces roseirectus TaxID=2768066 RepID=A0A7H0IR76_9ACTN|nr:hypothetical protein [Streptomyces roseirectus]QNP75292.1 hypothetical protein IAG44_41750 [Streptomyces roseirectus]